MKRLFSVLALSGALAVLLATVGSGAPAFGSSFSVLHARTAAAQTVTPTPPAVATTTPAVVTKTKTDHRGLWGLLGLLGLAGLLKRPRRETQTIVERPVSRPVDPTVDQSRR